MDLSKARTILGNKAESYSDGELQVIVDDLVILSQACCSIIYKLNKETKHEKCSDSSKGV